MMGMGVPYELGGRTDQKARTRQALVGATRRLMAAGASPTVDDVAAEAGISRTTAYRYFPNQRALLVAAHPQIELDSLLPDDAPTDPAARLDLVLDVFLQITLDWEPQLRASLRLSLEPSAALPPLRQGRAIGWVEDALEPMRRTHPSVDVHRLALAIRAATGIEALVWLTDIAAQSRTEATRLMRWSAHALLRNALDGNPPPRQARARRGRSERGDRLDGGH
jgi:AcrR family transcriptional regulator